MQIKSPLDNIDNSLIKLTVSVNGTPIKDEYAIKSIQVIHAVNKISYAEVVLQGNVNIAIQSQPITDNDDFNPGNSISITAGYGNAGEQSIFSGLIVNHVVEINPDTYFTFRIVGKHAAVAMTYIETDAEFFNQSDSDIISAITGNYGLTISVDNTADQQEVVFQKRTTDWDLILSRCDYNGFIVCMDGNMGTHGQFLCWFIGRCCILARSGR
jgi:phage protein D